MSRSLVTNIWGDFIKGVGKKINSSRNTYFWWENWAPLDQPLIYYTVRQHNSFNYSESISHHVLPNGQWNINKWVHVLPRWVIEKLKKTKPLDGQEKDQFRWRANNDGLFSVKEAYKFIQNTRHSTLEPLWKKIWRWPVSKRIKFFFWQVTYERLITNSLKAKYNLITNNECPFEYSSEESIIHVLCD